MAVRERQRPLQILPAACGPEEDSAISDETWKALQEHFGGVTVVASVREHVQEAFDLLAAAIRAQQHDQLREQLQAIADGTLAPEDPITSKEVVRELLSEQTRLRWEGREANPQELAASRLRRRKMKEDRLSELLGVGRPINLDLDRMIFRLARMLQKVGIVPQAYRSNATHRDGTLNGHTYALSSGAISCNMSTNKEWCHDADEPQRLVA